jgi:hypothetical protein
MWDSGRVADREPEHLRAQIRSARRELDEVIEEIRRVPG